MNTLYKFQEELAQKLAQYWYAKKVNSNAAVLPPVIKTGMGRHMIELRAVELFNHLNSAEQKIADNISKKLKCLTTVVSQRNAWSDLLTEQPNFLIQAMSASEKQLYENTWQKYLVDKEQIELNIKPTPFSTMKTKKLTPLQRAKAKAFNDGYVKCHEERRVALEDMVQQRDDYMRRVGRINQQLAVEQQKVKSLSAILQSIHTSAQAGATLLSVK